MIPLILKDENCFDLNDKYLRLKKKSIKKLITLPPKYLFRLNQILFKIFYSFSEKTGIWEILTKALKKPFFARIRKFSTSMFLILRFLI